MLFGDWLQKLRYLCGGHVSSRMRRRRPVGPARAAQVQLLENRVLLSANPVGSEFLVNTTTSGAQRTWFESPQAIAMDADGDFVVTWTSAGQDGNAEAVIVQRYDSAGNRVGSEIVVNTFTTGNQRYSTIAMDADGDFIVTWSSVNQDGSGYGIYARRFDKGGNPISTEFRVSTSTAGDQRQSSIAVSADGAFVIVWEGNGTVAGQVDTSGVFGQRFDRNGQAIGGEFRINETTADIQRYASVAMNTDGDFIVTWSSNNQDGAGYGVYARRYDRDGNAIGGEFLVNSYTTGNQLFSDVAIDQDGDFVITWTSAAQDGNLNGIFAQRYNSAGVGQGEFPVNVFTTNEQRYSRVAMNAAGDFTITWSSLAQDTNGEGVFAQRYNSDGTTFGSQLQVNTFITGNQTFPSIGMDVRGNFVIVWTSANQDGNGDGVYAQRFAETSADTTPPTWTDFRVNGTLVSGSVVNADVLNEGETILSPTTRIVVTFSENMLITTGNSISNLNNWTITKDGVSINNLVSALTFGLNAQTQKYEARIEFSILLQAGDYSITLSDVVRDLAGNRLDGDRDHVALGSVTRNFQIRLPHAMNGEQRVNTQTVGNQFTLNQSPQAVAMDANGNYAVVWLHDFNNNPSSPNYDVHLRLYDNFGNPTTAVIIVDGVLTNSSHPSIAMDRDGNIIVTWTDNGIWARRYSSNGVALGARFQVNQFGTNPRNSTIAIDGNGDFVIVWNSIRDEDANAATNDGDGIYGRRYLADGTPTLQGEFRINTTAPNNQRNPVVSMDGQGDFVVVWTSSAQDGSGEGIYVRRFDWLGQAVTPEIRVNTTVTGDQRSPSVGMDSDGDFIVVWTSSDGSGDGIYLQRYDRGGRAVGPETLVNTTTVGNQTFSRVAVDEDGDFVVTWVSENQDGDGLGIFARRYDRHGIPLSGEFRVNTFTTSNQTVPSVAMSDDGDFVIAWSSLGQDGSRYGVYTQLYHGGRRPTNITLDQEDLYQSALPGTLVGFLNTEDPDGPGETFIYTLVPGAGSTHNGFFQIIGNELYTLTPLTPGQTTYNIRVQVMDGGELITTVQLTVQTPDTNAAPTAVTLVTNNDAFSPGNPPRRLPELTSTAAARKVADIIITDDGFGQNSLYLTGDDADMFVILNGNELWLRSGVVLNFEDNPFLDVRVNVNDVTIGGNPDAFADFQISVTRLPQSAPVVSNFGGNLTYTEDAPPILISSMATVRDTDSPDFNTGRITVEITANASADDRLTIRNEGVLNGQINVILNPATGIHTLRSGQTVIGTFTGGNGANPLVITFNRNSTPAIVQAVLRNITFTNVSQNPSTAKRTIRVVVSDGDGGFSNAVTKTIAVKAVNDPPVITGFSEPVTYKSGDPPVLIDANQNDLVTDVDSADFNKGTLTISYTANGNANDRLAVRNQGAGNGNIQVIGSKIYFDVDPGAGVNMQIIGTISGGRGTSALKITFNSKATAAAVQAVLRNITFSNVSPNPSTLARSLRAVLKDGDGGTSVGYFKVVNVVKVNIAPTVNNVGPTVNYAKNNPAIQVFGNSVIVTDPDSTNFDGGVVRITLINAGQPSDVLSIASGGNGITVSGNVVFRNNVAIGTFSGGTNSLPLVINLNANANSAAVTALLKQIRFRDSSANPSAAQRTVAVTVSDGDGATSNPVAKFINVNLVTPSIGNFGGNVAFTEGNAPIIISSTATFSDSDSQNNFQGGTLTVLLSVNAEADDRLSINNQGAGNGNIAVSGNNVLFDVMPGAGVNMQIIGTFTGGDGANPLVITFNSNATQAAVQALIRRLQYHNASDAITGQQRTVTLSVTDDDGLVSNIVSKRINVTATNDVPVIGGIGSSVTYNRNTATPVRLGASTTLFDADNTDFNAGQLRVQLTNNIQATDRLRILQDTPGPNSVTIVGANVLYGGVVIGTWSGGDGATALVITFNSNATQAHVQAVMRNVAYHSVATPTSTVSLLPRTFSVQVTDGDGGTSNTLTSVLKVV